MVIITKCASTPYIHAVFNKKEDPTMHLDEYLSAFAMNKKIFVSSTFDPVNDEFVITFITYEFGQIEVSVEKRIPRVLFSMDNMEKFDKELEDLYSQLIEKGKKKTPSETDNVRKFREIVVKMHDTYVLKNHDYGDSFSKSVEKYGLIAALTRLSDKFGRVEHLITHHDQQVKDEALRDTLLDLASYAVMTIIELDKKS